MTGRTRLITLACGLSLLGLAHAVEQGRAATPSSPSLAAPRPWSAAGGTVTIRWNQELARDLGLRISPIAVSQRLGPALGDRFELDRIATLRFDVGQGHVRSLRDGALRAKGGYVLDARDGRIGLSGFQLVPRQSRDAGAPAFDLVGADGVAWFQVDRVMHELRAHDTWWSVATADILVSPRLAKRLGHPEVAGWTLGEMRLDAIVTTQGSGVLPLADAIRWHGEAAPGGGIYENDLFMKAITAQYMRCAGCTGPAGSGNVVIAPSSTLRNNVNNGAVAATVPGDPRGTSRALYAASIPWYSKFSGNFAPYGNDQHPYLIWNMYRVNADGSLEQIGRSGVKHAFLTTNDGCLDSNDHNSHVLGRGCDDTYSTSNNDFNNSLSSRREILPATGQWGRCGSTFDTNCDGVPNAAPSSDPYYERMVVGEQQLAPSQYPGAKWLFESWYLARQDIDIYNSMASLETTQQWNGTFWVVGHSSQRLGSVIDRWVAPAAAPVRTLRTGTTGAPTRVTTSRGGSRGLPVIESAEHTEELVVGKAHAKVAVRARRIGVNLWEYHYAVMNFDFAFVQTSGAEPNLRVISTQGFHGFELATSSSTTQRVFRDGDRDDSNNWSATQAAGSVRWNNGASTATSLGWGMLYSFSFTSTGAPSVGTATLHAAGAPVPTSYQVRTLVPAG